MSKSMENRQGEVFNYLSVVTSIILGLGLGHLLVGYARLINGRESVAWLYAGWIILLLPLYLMYWWVFWDYRNQVSWTFPAFFFLLLGPIGLYLITALLLPDTSNQSSLNVIARYLEIRRWFFGVWVVLQVWGILLSPWLKDGLSRKSFFNRYKVAQYILLVALVTGFFSPSLPRSPYFLDSAILLTFWLVVIYLLAAHRKFLRPD